jgi:hypothetical protein
VTNRERTEAALRVYRGAVRRAWRDPLDRYGDDEVADARFGLMEAIDAEVAEAVARAIANECDRLREERGVNDERSGQ